MSASSRLKRVAISVVRRASAAGVLAEGWEERVSGTEAEVVRISSPP
jgi:hypothetical protein